jgi:predicted PurR-regulated permease PerM
MPTPARTRSWPPLGRFVGYAATALGLVTLFALAWKLREVLLLAFGAVVIAAIIRTIARPAISRFPKREKLGILGAVLVLMLFLGGIGWLFGHQISEQMRGLGERLPKAMDSAKGWAEKNAVGRFVLNRMPGGGANGDEAGKQDREATRSGGETSTKGDEKNSKGGNEGEAGGVRGSLKQAVTLTLTSISHALLMLVAGIYFAFNPRLYVDGLTRLFPPAHRDKIRDALDTCGVTLQRWLLGQLISMATIGTLTAAGLALVGCPVPLALGLLAGLLVFVPIVGFLVAFVPTVLVALSESPQVALAAVIVFIVVQQLEEQVVLPLAQKWATHLPPALGLLALAATGVLFGIPGLIFGAPLAVVTMCLVRKLYLEHGIEKKAA